MRTLLIAALLTSAHAFAEGYTSPEMFNFSLARGEQTSDAEADLHVSLTGVSAKFGVKRSSRDGDFQPREVAVVDEPYLVRDGKGRVWRMWMRPAIGPEATMMQVELIRVEAEPRPLDADFRVASLTINGIEMPSTASTLELSANGTFQIGTLKGRYVRDERGGIVLEGALSSWGRGTFSLNGDALVFKYMRFNAEYQAHYSVAPTRAAPRW